MNMTNVAWIYHGVCEKVATNYYNNMTWKSIDNTAHKTENTKNTNLTQSARSCNPKELLLLGMVR